MDGPQITWNRKKQHVLTKIKWHIMTFGHLLEQVRTNSPSLVRFRPENYLVRYRKRSYFGFRGKSKKLTLQKLWKLTC